MDKKHLRLSAFILLLPFNGFVIYEADEAVKFKLTSNFAIMITDEDKSYFIQMTIKITPKNLLFDRKNKVDFFYAE